MDCENWVSIDTETSGFGKDAQILEVSVIHYWRGIIVRRWSELVCPVGLTFDNEHVKEALAHNKISIEALMYKAYTFKKVRERLESEISEPIWVIHNAAFDTRMLAQEYERLELSFPQAPFIFCTKIFDELINPADKGRKLENLCSRWGVQNISEHRAFGDAQATGDIFSKMLQVLPQDFDELLEMYETRTTLSWWKSVRNRA
jgi:DNA polymerase III alpha subunit (gram-positive type)